MHNKIEISAQAIILPRRCFVIAEAGSNHNGSVALAKSLVDSAKDCGCDAVKFQIFKTENLVTKNAGKADYQKGRSIGRTQFELLKSLELSADEHYLLIKHARKIGIFIFYSVFDHDSADLLEQLGVELYKLGSGELTNIPLIEQIAKKNKPLIISTGMGSDREIVDAVEAFRSKSNKQLILMHCSTGYPSRLENANLRRVKFLEKKFRVFCGNSDHTQGIIVSVVAAAMGVPLIEKHFTIDKNLPGPDQRMSMDPVEMRQLCGLVRSLEKKPVNDKGMELALRTLGVKTTRQEIQIILGQGRRVLSQDERKQRIWARKSLVFAKDLAKGEILTKEAIVIKRPQKGLLPKHYNKVINKKTNRAVKEGMFITWELLQ